MLVLLFFCTFNFFLHTDLLRTNILRLCVNIVRCEQIRLSFMRTLLSKVNKSVCYLPLLRKFFCFGFYRFVEFVAVILVFCYKADKDASCDNAFNIIAKGF